MTRDDFIAQLRQDLSGLSEPVGIVSNDEHGFSDSWAAARSDAHIDGDVFRRARQLRADAGLKRCWREFAGAVQASLQEPSDDA